MCEKIMRAGKASSIWNDFEGHEWESIGIKGRSFDTPGIGFDRGYLSVYPLPFFTALSTRYYPDHMYDHFVCVLDLYEVVAREQEKCIWLVLVCKSGEGT
jgi:hypothetical protein